MSRQFCVDVCTYVCVVTSHLHQWIGIYRAVHAPSPTTLASVCQLKSSVHTPSSYLVNVKTTSVSTYGNRSAYVCCQHGKTLSELVSLYFSAHQSNGYPCILFIRAYNSNAKCNILQIFVQTNLLPLQRL